MDEHEPITPEDDVEAHLLKEAIATGTAAAALLATAGVAQGASTPNRPMPARSMPTQVVLPDPGNPLIKQRVPLVGANTKAASTKRAHVKGKKHQRTTHAKS